MGRVRLVGEHIFQANDVRMLKLAENFDLSYGGDGKTFPFVVQTHLKKQDESNNVEQLPLKQLYNKLKDARNSKVVL